MNEKEDYFRISKNGAIHILRDRIPLSWKTLIVWPFVSFIITVYWLGLLVGIIIAILTLVGYILYRFTAWIFYSEIHIDEEKRECTLHKKILNRTQSVHIVTDTFDPNQFKFIPIQRSGKSKYLMQYRTHKNYDLLILKNEADKNLVEHYIREI